MTFFHTMNNREINALLDTIRTTCADISSTAECVVVNKSRTSILGQYASLISARSGRTKGRKLPPNQHTSDALLLLLTWLEDTRSFLEKFASLNKDLAIDIVKGGSHCLKFIKLTEQLEHCCILVHLDIDFPERMGSTLIAQIWYRDCQNYSSLYLLRQTDITCILL